MNIPTIPEMHTPNSMSTGNMNGASMNGTSMSIMGTPMIAHNY